MNFALIVVARTGHINKLREWINTTVVLLLYSSSLCTLDLHYYHNFDES